MPSATPATVEVIRVRGARTHNLQALDVDIPRDRLVVITGVSGSGKSTLAFDTLFAEGERRYLDNLSGHARQEFQTVSRPDVDEIDGLPPVLAIAQRTGRVSPRSTLGTLTEIHDFLRVLYARVGVPHCPHCGRVIRTQPVDAIVDRILALETGRKVMLLAPLVRDRKGAHKEVFERIVRDGLVRARVDGEIIDAADPPKLKKTRTHTIEAVIDRIVVKDGLRPRLLESVHLALKHGEGTCVVTAQEGDGWRDELYSARFACPDCQKSFLPIEPGTFSFNTAAGACPRCQGLGEVDGLVCAECGGSRLSPLARAVLWNGRGIHELGARSIVELSRDFSTLPEPEPADKPVLERLLPEIRSRLDFLDRVGLGYLTLDRAATTLSGGELQRARLARSLGAGLIGMCYILDEPTQGLHPRDTARLLETLTQLRDQVNSVIVVEHDVDVMRAADWLIDIGPGAGRDGGRLVAQGTPEDVARSQDSLTAPFLQGTGYGVQGSGKAMPSKLGATGGLPASVGRLTVTHANARNLKDVTARFPSGAITAVTGVSGSGKTSLILETLVPSVRSALGSAQRVPNLEGAESFARLIVVDQSPLGRSGRSNPATASGVCDAFRRLFARTKDARLRGFGPKRFSFNDASGRCAVCRGTGTRRLSAASLAGLEMPCPECRGLRFNRQTLQVRFKGKNVADVLALRIHDAFELFSQIEPIRRTLATFVEIGLGYLTLGQPAPTLSGGEAQRIKLAAELGKTDELTAGRTLYVLDEPTTGLHPADVQRLLTLLRRLADQGHTVIVIEHQLDVIAAADWIVDLGPEAGDGGGQIVAEGTPDVVAGVEASHTGRALARVITQT